MTPTTSGLWLPATARDKSDFRKADPPVTGEKFGHWAGRDLQFATLPGGSVLQFDLSRLTLNDYRMMRDHYQINANLTLLTFMIHQIDWKIECEDKKIAREIESQIRPLWAQIIRAFSQAFWAGYSPMVLQYENDVQGRRVVLDKVKDLLPEEAKVNWKEVEGYSSTEVKPKLKVYDGIKHHGQRDPIPVDNTLWWPLLMENGDYYGRKLLKPAFISWFFSNLIHLFANRYYERFGEPLPIGRADYEQDVTVGDDKVVSGREAMEGIIKSLRSRSVVVMPSDRDENDNYTFDIEYLECVDEETEIFTSTGWKRYDELSVGEEVLSLNHKTGMSEWDEVKKVNVHEVVDRDMILMEGTTHSSFTTENHRWPVLHTYVRGGRNVVEREWQYTASLGQRDRIPLCAPHSTFPITPKYDDDFVELVAWYWTEGYLFDTGNYATISQKRYPERIRAALTRLFGPAREEFPRHKWGDDAPTEPMWRENGKKEDEENRQFFLNYVITQMLNQAAPNKIVEYDFIRSLTKAQLDLFIEASLLADGNVTGRQTFLMQKSREMAERFQFACTLAGHATSLYPQEEKRHDDYFMWVVSVRRKTVVNPIQSNYANGPFSIEKKKYTGKVWCPTTRNQTWLARRNGTVYFTGNSQMRGADWERYMTRLDEEMSLGLFTPILMLRTADVGSYNLGVNHMQVWMWMLNALAGDLKLYLDKYLVERLKAFNFTPNAPRAQWSFRLMGKNNSETIRAVVTELIRNEKVGPADLDELGQYLGLSLKEIRQIKGDEEDPEVDPRTGRPERTTDKPARTQETVENSNAIRKRMVDRVRGQVSKAFKTGTFGTDEFFPVFGYQSAFTDALVADGFPEDEAVVMAQKYYERMEQWCKDFLPLGKESFDNPNKFMATFDAMSETSLRQVI